MSVLRSDTAELHWSDDEDIVLQEQPATAVYRNKHGGVVVRQQKQFGSEVLA